MKVILKDNQRYIIRIDKGEEVFAGFLEFARQYDIDAASFTAIGACGELEIGVYDFAAKSYTKQVITEQLEIVSLIGNIALSAGKPALHVHGSFSRRDLSMLGGHVFKAVISATCEIFLIKLDGEMSRGLDSDLNLNLLQ